MATYLMFGKYSPDGLKQMSPQRTRQVVQLVEQQGGKVQAMYATLGEQDLVFVVDLPGTEQAMAASVAMSKSTGIAFTTAAAVSVEEFDKLVG